MSPSARRCASCGAGAEIHVSGRRGGLGRKGVFAGVMIIAGFGFWATRQMVDVVDLYLDAVTSHVPQRALQFQDGDDRDAFDVCARAAARRVGTDSSVLTFAERKTAVTRVMDDGRLSFHGYVEEAAESGNRLNHAFDCTVTRDREQWVVREIRIEEIEDSPFQMVATRQ